LHRTAHNENLNHLRRQQGEKDGGDWSALDLKNCPLDLEYPKEKEKQKRGRVKYIGSAKKTQRVSTFLGGMEKSDRGEQPRGQTNLRRELYELSQE